MTLPEVDDLAETAEDVDRLVLGAVELETGQRLALGDLAVLDALHEAGRTDLVLDQVLLDHRLGRDRLEVVEVPLAPVARREGVDAVEQAHHLHRALRPVGGDAGVVLARRSQLLDEACEVVGTRDLDRLLTVEDEPLELLGAHDGADTAAAQLVPLLVVDAGEADEVLAGRADGARPGPWATATRSLMSVLGLVGVTAPDAVGRMDRGAGLGDLEEDRRRRRRPSTTTTL